MINMIWNVININKHKSLTNFTRYIKYGKILYKNGDEKPHSGSKAHRKSRSSGRITTTE